MVYSLLIIVYYSVDNKLMILPHKFLPTEYLFDRLLLQSSTSQISSIIKFDYLLPTNSWHLIQENTIVKLQFLKAFDSTILSVSIFFAIAFMRKLNANFVGRPSWNCFARRQQKILLDPGARRLELEPWGWDLSLEAGIWALRLGFEPRGWDLSLEDGI